MIHKVTSIKLEGDQDYSRKLEIRTRFDEIAEVDHSVVDLTRVEYIDSIFVAELVRYAQRATAPQTVTVRAANQPLRVLELVGMGKLLNLVAA